MNHFPLDFDHEVVKRYEGNRDEVDNQISCVNKVMANMFDNGRSYDFDSNSSYNKSNASKKNNLIWIKFKHS